MKCPHCNTNVVKIPVNWKCPQCGEDLPTPGFWHRFFEGLGDYLLDRTFIFWTVIFGFFLLVLGIIEAVLGNSFLLNYITGNVLFAILMMVFAGMLIENYMNIVLPLRLIGGSGFMIKERLVIRHIRKGTHIAAIVGLLICLFWLGPRMFLTYFPSYLIVISVFLALAWSIAGLFLDIRMAEDVRFRAFMDRLGITSLKTLRKTCTFVIGALFIAIVGFWILLLIPGLWNTVSQWPIVAGPLFFFRNYMGWLL